MTESILSPTYQERINALRATKHEHTRWKQEKNGPQNTDDKGSVPPPEGFMFIPDDDYFGLRGCGRNYRRYLEEHPVYVDPISSLAGAWRAWYYTYLPKLWPDGPEFEFRHLHENHHRYKLISGIGGMQHFCPDVRIGLDLGWGGLLDNVQRYRAENAEAGLSDHQRDFYDGMESILVGMQNWIQRHVTEAERMAETEDDPLLRDNLHEMADMNRRLVSESPKTFREACQWIAWAEMFLCMYNGSCALGQIDEMLRPYYERDVQAGVLDDEEAVFHLACMLLKDPHFMQLGGLDAEGNDLTSRVSSLVLEAAHRLGVPQNITIRVHDEMDEEFFDLGVKYLFADRNGTPNWAGAKGLDEGFVRSGYPMELARGRVKGGCHWFTLPGREYTMSDLIKINLAAVFQVAIEEMWAEGEPGTKRLWELFESHLRCAVETIAQGIDFHLEHFVDVLPELPLDLFCHGPVETGRDITDGGVEYYNIGVDGSALATVADSFAALEQRVERESVFSWDDMKHLLDTDFENAERARGVLAASPKFCGDGSLGDEYAARISRLFSDIVRENPTPGGRNMIPDHFTWAVAVGMGKSVGATPDGRHAGEPIGHGPNPLPAPGNTPTSMSRAVAGVECGYGNASPLQLDMDPGFGGNEFLRNRVGALIRTHFDMGGTMMNINVIDRERILVAHDNPDMFPDLIVRATGFSAYFASLSEDFRQEIVDRIVHDGA